MMALLQKRPDGVVILLGHSEIRLALVWRFGPILIGNVEVHPIAEPDRLIGLNAGELIDPVLAHLHELGNGSHAVSGYEVLDVAFRFHPNAAVFELFFNLDLDPQPLTVEALLIAQFMAGHGEIALVDILVRPAPGMMHAHRIVGSDGTIEKRPFRLAAILFAEFGKGVNLLPEIENELFLRGEIDLRFNLVKRHSNEPRRKHTMGISL